MKTDVTIANSGTTSGAADLKTTRLIGLWLPSALTGTTMTIQGSLDGNATSPTYQDVYDDAGNQVSITVAASQGIGFDHDVAQNLRPFRWVKVVSGSAEGAARTIGLISE